MGTIVFSIDAEIVGSGELLPEKPEREVHRRRQMWLELLNLFEQYDIPVTWAVVGRLFGHRNSPSLSVSDLTDEAREHLEDPELYISRHRSLNESYAAPDLIDAIDQSPVDHEIGSHSFSHLRFTDLRPEAARQDFEACHTAADSADISLSSFVFPRNAVNHVDVIRDCGFTAYRGRPHRTPGGETVSQLQKSLPGLGYIPDGLKRTAGQLIDNLATVQEYALADEPPALITPTKISGIISVPASTFLFRLPEWQRRFLHRLRIRPTVRRAKQGIDAAIKRDGVFHAWFHPHDLHGKNDLESIRCILDYIRTRRKAGDVVVKTMSSVM